MTKQIDLAAEIRRLHLLKTLQVASGYRASADLLKMALQNMGDAAPTSVIKADLAWLEQLGLVSTTEHSGMTIALLRNEGVDVASGTSVVPGIARAQPE
ncbi:hypothetical protein CEK71_13530 [Methylovulum psychrotolerans]|uniref:ArsR family transcriptional regulator n=1 Tax=Methylovulum psychrotolerans TaxID=1704499 RepID=A0A1Z4C0G6_9GAMM|nr:hypothetical protein [Methylovulum psychrotolerans]ASF47010.1 hypothetical protein CEK71_13530 [Methylovulum psychrotolerans]